MLLSLGNKVLEHTAMVLYTYFVMKMLSYWQKSRDKYARVSKYMPAIHVQKRVHMHAGETKLTNENNYKSQKKS